MKTTVQRVDKVYKLTRNAAPLSFMLATRHTRRFPLLWVDPETGINRELRYARNQSSPFVDEQDDNAIIEPVIFEDGFLRVTKNNQVLQRFLDVHPHNGVKFGQIFRGCFGVLAGLPVLVALGLQWLLVCLGLTVVQP